MSEIIKILGLMLLTVLVIEVPCSLLFGIKGYRELILVAGINCLTNPLLNFLLIFFWGDHLLWLVAVIFGEITVILIESKLLELGINRELKTNYLAISFYLNTISFFGGLIINYFM